MGQVGTRFGRNIDPKTNPAEPEERRMDPNPREVATRLLHRDSFKPATSLNVLAACWIQFENHDWFGHGENDPERLHRRPAAARATPGRTARRCRSGRRTRAHRHERQRQRGGAAADLRQHGHSLVGRLADLRLHRGAQPRAALGRGREDGDRRGRPAAERDRSRSSDGVDLTGFSDNYWIGLSLLHTLFVKEHNAICDHLRGSYPTWDDEQLFLTARLVNSALMAKIHTVEWTPGILANPVLERAMHANWYGVLPQWVRQQASATSAPR